MDLEDSEFGTKLGAIIAQARKLDVKTALDFVSPDKKNLFKFLRYKKTIQNIDILCINEDQACSLTELEEPKDACVALVEELGATVSVVHCGAKGPNYAYSTTSGLIEQRNFTVADSECKGNAGAGDAFSAGFLHGTHEGWSIEKSLKFAAAAAAISLGHESCTGAMQSRV